MDIKSQYMFYNILVWFYVAGEIYYVKTLKDIHHIKFEILSEVMNVFCVVFLFYYIFLCEFYTYSINNN